MNVPLSPAASAQAHGLPTDLLHQLIFADSSMVVQDAEVHAFAFDWMGAGAIKRCPCCLNIVSKQCNMVRDPTGTTIPVYTAYTRRFKLISNNFSVRCWTGFKTLHCIETARIRVQI